MKSDYKGSARRQKQELLELRCIQANNVAPCIKDNFCSARRFGCLENPAAASLAFVTSRLPENFAWTWPSARKLVQLQNAEHVWRFLKLANFCGCPYARDYMPLRVVSGAAIFKTFICRRINLHPEKWTF